MAATIQQIVKPTRARGLDTSGNNNHAQIYSGRALEFDGVTDYLTVNGGTDVTFVDWSEQTTQADKAWTVSFWVKLNTNLSSYQRITGHTSSIAGYIAISGQEKISVYSLDDGAWQTWDTALDIKSWYRVVVVFDGSTKLTAYLNGVSLGDKTITEPTGDNGDLKLDKIGDDNGNYYFEGHLSDFQAWQGAWTAADAEYDYLNPEQLALNRGGTSLTNSNLKLWYPMNDGHRGDQSYVLDASNTGLGDIMETTTGTTNAYMSEDTGWLTQGFDDGDTTIPVDGSNEKAFYTTDKYVTGSRSLYFKTVDTDQNENIFAQYNFVAGTTYKFFARVWVVDQGNGQMPGLYQSDSRFQNGVIKFPTAYGEWQELEMILTCDSSGIGNNQIGGSGPGKTVEFYLDEFWVKPINDKHNATTVFYGDELVSNSTFETSSANWTLVYQGGSGSGASIDAANTSSPLDGSKDLKIVNTSAGENAGAVSNGISFIAGRTYQVSYKYKASASGCKGKIGHLNDSTGGNHIGGSSQQDLDNTTETDHSYTFTSTETETNYVTFIVPDGVTLQVDNISVKEVGAASGWTGADQQLDIPQTALQSYNQLAFSDDYRSGISLSDGGTTTHQITTNSHTWSFWMFRNQEDSDTFHYILQKGEYQESGYYIYLTGGKLNFVTNTSGANQSHATDATVPKGKWFHAAITVYSSGTASQWYINGQAESSATGITAPVANTDYTSFYAYDSDNTTPPTAHPGYQCLTELSSWSKQLSEDEIQEIYNDGLALDCTTHSASANLVGYWRNNGLAEWEDLSTNNYHGTPTSITETMLITAGVDSSRDSQGFLMNRQRTTNSLNLPLINIAGNTYTIGSSEIEIPNPSLTYSDTGFSVECWFKAAILGEPMFFICHQEASNSGEGFHLRWAGGNIVYAVISDGTNEASAAVSGTLNADQWYHIVASWDHSNKKKYVYIDGILRQVETESSMGTIAPNADIHIGTRRGEADQDFIGQIDDVKLYNRILTDGDVTSGVADNSNLSIAAKGEVTRNYNAGKRSHR